MWHVFLWSVYWHSCQSSNIPVYRILQRFLFKNLYKVMYSNFHMKLCATFIPVCLFFDSTWFHLGTSWGSCQPSPVPVCSILYRFLYRNLHRFVWKRLLINFYRELCVICILVKQLCTGKFKGSFLVQVRVQKSIEILSVFTRSCAQDPIKKPIQDAARRNRRRLSRTSTGS